MIVEGLAIGDVIHNCTQSASGFMKHPHDEKVIAPINMASMH